MLTNFAALHSERKLVWSRQTWKAARDQMFFKKFTGSGENNVVHRVTELTKTEKGDQCIFHLVADLVEDGGIGDDEREGHEEAMQSYDQTITIDLINHGVRNKGKLADQKTVIRFRENGRDRLAYWLANRSDQLRFLTLSGISYAFKNDGSARGANSKFAQLAFAGDVVVPSSNRHVMYNGTDLVASNTGSITSAYVLKYGAIVDLVSYAKAHYVKPLMAGGKEYYVFFCRPEVLAQLKKDADYQRAIVTAMPRGTDNPFFTGGTVTIDGLVIHEHRLVYNTKGADSGSKWGGGGLVNGTRSLLCGAQALGEADIGAPTWVEKEFQYESQQGINVDKMFGLLKPQFRSIYDDSTEDFGVVAVDSYIQ